MSGATQTCLDYCIPGEGRHLKCRATVLFFLLLPFLSPQLRCAPFSRSWAAHLHRPHASLSVWLTGGSPWVLVTLLPPLAPLVLGGDGFLLLLVPGALSSLQTPWEAAPSLKSPQLPCLSAPPVLTDTATKSQYQHIPSEKQMCLSHPSNPCPTYCCPGAAGVRPHQGNDYVYPTHPGPGSDPRMTGMEEGVDFHSKSHGRCSALSTDLHQPRASRSTSRPPLPADSPPST